MDVQLISLPQINWRPLLQLSEKYLSRHLSKEADNAGYTQNDPRTYVMSLESLGICGNIFDHMFVGFFIACDRDIVPLLIAETKNVLLSEETLGYRSCIITTTLTEWKRIVLALCNGTVDARLNWIGNQLYDCFEKLKIEEYLWPRCRKRPANKDLFKLECP